jgi:Heterokaryon incompatibility protein (HET)
MMETIDETTISKSFQDAITITRGLHIRYLWIDALCIIQDSAEDWAIESAKMAQYYKGGSVMISALASPGAGHGILHPRPSDTNAVNVSLHNHDLYIRPALEDAWSVIQDETHFHSRVRQEISIQPLNTRAWTLQERLFAPRIIHYAAQQLIWQCKTCIASEDNQFSFLPGGQVLSPVIDLVNLDTERSTNVGKNIRPTIQSTGWYNLLQGYTKRQITYPSDLLPGISGLAREIQYLTGIKYLAGIWEGSPSILLHSLLWRVGSSSRNPPPTRSHNDSPTWSWSSLRGEITQLEKGPRNFISQPFLDPVFFLREATPLTANPYGQVSGGRIQVSGFVHAYTGPSTFAEFQTRKLVERLGIGDKEEGLHAYDESALIYDNSSSRDPYTDLAAITAIGEAQQEPQIQLDIPDVGYDFSTRGKGEGGEQHILLFMGRWNDDPKSDDDLSAEQQFLLLRRVRMTDGSRKSAGKWPVFERVGIAEVQSPYLLDISAAEGWKRRTGILV